MTFWQNQPGVQEILQGAFSAQALHSCSVANHPIIVTGENCMPEKEQPGSPIDILVAAGRKRAFIVADDFSARSGKRIGAFLETGKIEWEIWDGAQPEVPTDTVEICLEKVKQFEPDIIFGFGGGSAMDTAKAVWIRYEREDLDDLRLVGPLLPLGLRKKALFGAIPTTAGTGSECSYGAVLHDVITHQKFAVMNPELIPDFAFLDPKLHASMPPQLTVGSGLDALAHSIDSVTNPVCLDIPEALAAKAVETTFEWLPKAYKDGSDMDARYKMMMAASMAGMAMNLSIPHVTHLLGHAFGAVANQHHGKAVGIFIPHSLQWCSSVTDRHVILCRHLGLQGNDPKDLLDKLVNKVRGLLSELDVPLKLSDIMEEKEFNEKLDQMAQFAYNDVTRPFLPRPVTLEEVRKIFEYAYDGKDIDF